MWWSSSNFFSKILWFIIISPVLSPRTELGWDTKSLQLSELSGTISAVFQALLLFCQTHLARCRHCRATLVSPSGVCTHCRLWVNSLTWNELYITNACTCTTWFHQSQVYQPTCTNLICTNPQVESSKLHYEVEFCSWFFFMVKHRSLQTLFLKLFELFIFVFFTFKCKLPVCQ